MFWHQFFSIVYYSRDIWDFTILQFIIWFHFGQKSYVSQKYRPTVSYILTYGRTPFILARINYRYAGLVTIQTMKGLYYSAW